MINKSLDYFVLLLLFVPLVGLTAFITFAAILGHLKQKSRYRKIRRLCHVCARLFMKPKEMALLVNVDRCTACKRNKSVDTK